MDDALFVPRLAAVQSSDLLAYPYQRKVVNFNNRYVGKVSLTTTAETQPRNPTVGARKLTTKVRALSAPHRKQPGIIHGGKNGINNAANEEVSVPLKRSIVSAQPNRVATTVESVEDDDNAAQGDFILYSERGHFDFDNPQNQQESEEEPSLIDDNKQWLDTDLHIAGVLVEDSLDAVLTWLIGPNGMGGQGRRPQPPVYNNGSADAGDKPFLWTVGSVRRSDAVSHKMIAQSLSPDNVPTQEDTIQQPQQQFIRPYGDRPVPVSGDMLASPYLKHLSYAGGLPGDKEQTKSRPSTSPSRRIETEDREGSHTLRISKSNKGIKKYLVHGALPIYLQQDQNNDIEPEVYSDGNDKCYDEIRGVLAKQPVSAAAKSTTISPKQVRHLMDQELQYPTVDRGDGMGDSEREHYNHGQQQQQQYPMAMVSSAYQLQHRMKGIMGMTNAKGKLAAAKFKNQQLNFINSSVVTVESLFLNSLQRHKKHELANRTTFEPVNLDFSPAFDSASLVVVGGGGGGIDPRLLAAQSGRGGRMLAPPVRLPPQQGNRGITAAGTTPHQAVSATDNRNGKSQGVELNAALGMDLAYRVDIHADPLYGILREETERQQNCTNSAAGIRPASSGTHKQTKTSEYTSSKQQFQSRSVFLQSKEFFQITASDLKSLHSFVALPAGTWITMKIVYFILAAFHESVIMNDAFGSYRQHLDAERIWELLRNHAVTVGLTSACTDKEFSWTFLQELLGLPALCARLMTAIEYGLNDPSESEIFPHCCSFEMIASLRQLLLKGGAGLFDANSLVAASPAVAKVCGWSKRIIAMLYADNLSKIRSLDSSVRGRKSSVHLESPSPSLSIFHDTTERIAPIETKRSVETMVLSSFLSIYVAAVCQFPRAERWHRQQAQRRRQNKPAELLVDNSPHLQLALALAKPTDQLSLMVIVVNIPPLPHPPSVQTQCAAVLDSYETQLRYVSLSPLHKVVPLMMPLELSADGMIIGGRVDYRQFFDHTNQNILSESVSTYGSAMVLQQQQQQDQKHEQSMRDNEPSELMTMNSFRNMDLVDDAFNHAANTTKQPWRRHRVPTNSTDISYLLYSFGLELHPAVAYVVSVTARHHVPHAKSSISNVNPRAELPEPPLLVVAMAPGGTLPTLLQRLSSTDSAGSTTTNNQFDNSFMFNGNISSRDAVVKGMAEIGGAQKLSFSLVLSSCQPSITGQQQQYKNILSTMPRSDSSALPKRFLVFVKDSDNSWAAFQMARRLAKPSDSIVIVHVPVLLFAQSTATDLRTATAVPTYLSERRYQHALQNANIIAQRLSDKYKAAGFNLYVADAVSYLEEAKSVFEAHCDLISFESIAFSARQRFCLEKHRGDNSFFFLANRRTCSVATSFLQLTVKFAPCFILLGSDCADISSAIAGPNSQLHLLTVNNEMRFQQHLDAYLSAVAVCRAAAKDETNETERGSNTFITASIPDEPAVAAAAVPAPIDDQVDDMYDEESFEAPVSISDNNRWTSQSIQGESGQLQDQQEMLPGQQDKAEVRMVHVDESLFDWEEVAETFIDFSKNRLPLIEALLHILSATNSKKGNNVTADCDVIRAGEEHLMGLSIVLCNRYDNS